MSEITNYKPQITDKLQTQIRHALSQFLVIAMQIAHNGFERDHGFTVECDIHAKHTVGAGVLGADVDSVSLSFKFRSCHK